MRNRLCTVGQRVLIFGLFSIFLSFQLLSVSFAQGTRPETAQWGYRGQTAINQLGTRLPEVAKRYNMTADELARTFRTDFNLWVDKFDRLVFLDEFVPQNGATIDGGGTAAAGPVPYTQTFFLHSLPGASKVIYLDFDGHTTSSTLWNKNFNNPSSTVWGNDIVSLPFDMDGVAGFSTTEQDRIQYIWQRVAEQYAPFGVDVTTEDPGVEGLRNLGGTDANWGIRVVISPTNSFYPNAGGVAYIGSFNWNVNDTTLTANQSATPCFVFSSMLGPNSEKYVADAIAHEVGHTLGLSHDGANASTMTTATGYYYGNYDTATSTTFAGTPQWAPIMGCGYYQSLTQWSKGEYTGANQLQDDLAVMTSSYGITYRTDDHSNTIAGATPLTVSGSAVSGKGIIERTTDVDYVSFQTGAGTVSFSVTGGPRVSDLDIQVKLFDANNVQILLNNPVGLTSSFSTTLAAGTYYLAIEGVGTGDPLSRFYSDYGSLGEFNVSGTVVSTTATAPTAPTNLMATAASASQINLTWSDLSSNETGFKVERSLDNATWTLVTTTGSNVVSYSYTGLTANTLYYFRVRATNAVGDSANSNIAQATTPATPPAAPTSLTATAASGSQINLTWVDASNNETGFKLERSLNNSTWTLVANPAAGATSYSDINLTSNTLYYYRIRANNNAGDSANSNVASATTQGTTAATTAAIHIGDIDHVTAKAKTGTTWSTTVTITVHKTGETILANAKVAATWSNGTTASCLTTTKGTCTMSLSSLASTVTGVTFSVNSVTLSGYTYAAASNHDPDGSSNGTTTSIVKPL